MCDCWICELGGPNIISFHTTERIPESQYPLLGPFKMPLIVSILLAGIHKQQNLNCGLNVLCSMLHLN